MPIEPLAHIARVQAQTKIKEQKKPDKLDSLGSNEAQLDRHWTQFERSEDLYDRISILRSILKIPGSRGYARVKLQECTASASHIKIFAALLGAENKFRDNATAIIEKLEGETLLGLACEGGSVGIIKSVYENNPATLFEKPSLFGKRPADYLTPEVAAALAQDDKKFAALWAEYQKPGLFSRIASGVLSVVSAPIRGGRRLIANMAQAWERKKRIGSMSVEGEQRVAMPILGIDSHYEAKKALYDAFESDQQNVMAHINLASQEKYSVDYLRANTFHFLGGLIERGYFEAAKKMIEAGLYNEASPRLFLTLNLSSMTINQQFELLNLMLTKASDVDQQVLITRHMLTMPDGKEAIQSDAPVVKALTGKDVDVQEGFVLKNGQTWAHLVCEGGNVTAISRVIHPHRSILLTEDKNGNRPIDFMTLETANKLDEFHRQDPKKKGSFSMAVMHSIYVRIPMRWREFVPGVLTGKFSGAIVVSGMLPLIDQVATMGGASALAHMGAAIGTAAMINVPVYGGVLTGAKLTSWAGRRWWKTSKAKDLGLDDSLAYDEKSKPIFEDPKYRPYMDPRERSDWLSVLCQRSHGEEVESLLESQLDFGGLEIKQAIANAIRQHTQPSVAHLRSYFLTAVRMADLKLMAEIQDKFPDPKDALWLDTFEQSNTVMHVATQTGNVEFIKKVAEHMRAQMQARFQRAGAKNFTHTLPETTKVTAFSRAKTFVESEGGLWKSQLPWDFNPFSMSNSYGQTPAELLPAAVARKLDEEYELDADKPGSFMQVTRERLAAQEMILGAQVSCAIPAKIVMNVKLAHTVAAVVLAGKGLGATHGGPVGAVLGGACADFLFGTGIALGGFAIGAITGEGFYGSLKSAQDSLRGYANEMTQLTDSGLQQAKGSLATYCMTLSDQAEEVFKQSITRPEQLVDLLTELATRDKEFAGKFGKVIAQKAATV